MLQAPFNSVGANVQIGWIMHDSIQQYSMAKFIFSLGDENFRLLAAEAKVRGITIQELIRAVIIPTG